MASRTFKIDSGKISQYQLSGAAGVNSVEITIKENACVIFAIRKAANVFDIVGIDYWTSGQIIHGDTKTDGLVITKDNNSHYATLTNNSGLAVLLIAFPDVIFN